MLSFFRRYKKQLPDPEPSCSFCGKAQAEVTRLIAGRSVHQPDAVFICDECIDICVEIFTEDRERDEHPSPPPRRCVRCHREPDIEAGITVTAALICSRCRQAQP